jgi:glutamate-1-semialdehyde aminotransferase
VVEAVGCEIGGGATMSLPHLAEVETGRAVLAAFPHHQMVQFGKNGSDVCTLAVRMMRTHTGRRKILFWGYHGWQDWFAARLGFEATGVTGDAADLHAFVYGDAPALLAYLEQWGDRIAGIIMEPGAAVLGIEGPIPEVDAVFLRAVREACTQHRILLAFDEIYTGFRHPGGSAQAAAGVSPDITLLGKGLAAGYPLGALLTQTWLFESTAGRVMYGPTYKGERIALAACRAALSVYRETDVPAQIHAFGTSLRIAVLSLPEASQLELRWEGPPYRQMAVIGAGASWLRAVRRTLLLQELLRRGVLSYKGLFLPSAAHGDRELDETVRAFRAALQVIVRAGNGPEAVRFLEIPPSG